MEMRNTGIYQKAGLILICLISFTSFLTADFPQDGNVFLVLGQVEKVTEVSEANRHLIVESLEWSGLSPPVFEAACLVEEVLQGPAELKGKRAYGMTRDKMMIGNFSVILPSLKIGETGIFPVYLVNDHLCFLPNVGNPIAGGEVPSIQGRDPNFEKLLQRLRHRRDHPEDQRKEEKEGHPSTAVTSMGASPRDSYQVWWIAVGAAVMLSLVAWLRKRQA